MQLSKVRLKGDGVIVLDRSHAFVTHHTSHHARRYRYSSTPPHPTSPKQQFRQGGYDSSSSSSSSSGSGSDSDTSSSSSDSGAPRSAISGKKIKMKLKRDAVDKQMEKGRQDFLRFLNSQC